jgi:hypothetical protein
MCRTMYELDTEWYFDWCNRNGDYTEIKHRYDKLLGNKIDKGEGDARSEFNN